jgi:hypothetical protein
VVDVLCKCWIYVRRREDEDLGDGNGVEPALDPAPNSGEKAWCTYNLRYVSVPCAPKSLSISTYKDPVQCLRVMRCRQNRSILHMVLEVPKLFQPNSIDVYDIVAL